MDIVASELMMLVDNGRRPKVRRVTVNGRAYMVAPATLIVPGVVAGSQGPLLYTNEQVGINPSGWDGMPIVVYHPVVNGKNVSARRPDILERQWVGHVFNTAQEVKSGRLQAELWFDEEATKRVDPRVYEALEQGQKIELSTGLFSKKKAAPDGAIHNAADGRQVPYVGEAVEIRPDHVAVLPDRQGACALTDGCGVLVNEASFDQLRERVEKALAATVTQDRPGCWVMEMYETKAIYRQGDELYEVGYAADDSGTVTLQLPATRVVRQITYVPMNNEEGDAVAKLTDNERRDRVEFIIANCDCWRGPTSKEELSKLSDDQLTRLRDGVSTTNQKVEAAAAPGAAPITVNGVTLSWDGKAWVPAAPPAPSQQTGATAPTTNGAAVSPADWYRNAPPEVQEYFQESRAVVNEKKEELVSRLLSNTAVDKRPVKREWLLKKGVQELRDMAEMMGPVANQQDDPDDLGIPLPHRPRRTGAGVGGGAGPTTNEGGKGKDDDDLLETPVSNWSDPPAGSRRRQPAAATAGDDDED